MSEAIKKTIYSYKITEKDQGRLDLLLSSSWNLSRSFVQELLKKNLISCSEELKAKKLPSLGTELFYEKQKFTFEAQKAEHFQVIFEDEYVIVLNKKPGISVHPGHGKKEKTLIQELFSIYPFLKEIDQSLRPGLIHRLDEGTSGLLLIGKNREAVEKFSLLFQERKIKKIYHALIEGSYFFQEQKIKTFIDRHPKNPLKKTSLTSKGKEALSVVKKLRTLQENIQLLEIEIFTGRTHQIRVHCAEQLKKPLLGDTLYGFQSKNPVLQELLRNYPYPLLHAYSLSFLHPFKKEKMTFIADYPWKFASLLKNLS